MAVKELANGLSEHDRGHLKYLRHLALQPLDSWEGFYETKQNRGPAFLEHLFPTPKPLV